MDLLDSQPEFTKSFWDYLDILVTDARIAKGRALLAKYADTFARAERAYGVSRYRHRRHLGRGKRTTARSAATGRCCAPPRRSPASAGGSAISAANSSPPCRSSSIATCRDNRLVGSWAGAFGPTQFMPTAFLRYAVDFDGDGRRDVIDSVPDLIASTANNLKKDGWAAGAHLGLRSGGAGGFRFPARRRSGAS